MRPRTFFPMMIHLYKEGRELGPYTLEEVQARLRSGEISESDMAAVDGGPQMPLGALLATIPVEVPPASAPTPPPAAAAPQPVKSRLATVSPVAARGQFSTTGDSNRGCLWVAFGIVCALALLGAAIYFRTDGGGKLAVPKSSTVTGADSAASSDDEGESLADMYVRKLDGNALGLIHVEKVTKGRSYVSHGEHGIRAGITVEPTLVDFTGWGFGGRSLQKPTLQRFRVTSTWWCFQDDYGRPMVVADQHEVHPISGDTPPKEGVPKLGAVGMTVESMEQMCGPAVRAATPKPEDGGVRRMTWRKDGYAMNCLLLEGRVYSITYSRADQPKARNTDKIIWLLQNGAHWSGPNGYSCLDNGMVGKVYSLGDGDTGRYECLEVTDPKVLAAHHEQATVLAPAPPDGVHMPQPPYPIAARKQHIQGSGVCHVVFGVTGRVTSATMKQSTGSDTLDNGTIDFVKANWTGVPDSTKDVEVVYRMN